MTKPRKPKQGETISLLHESGVWREFTVHWVDDEMLVLDSFSKSIPMTWKELSRLLEGAE